MQTNGTLGLIATNTVAQGDTREVGLDALVAKGFTITRAIQSRSWPASSANLEYAAVWGTLAPVFDGLQRVADEVPVRSISTLLEPTGRAEGLPIRLAENLRHAYIGSIVNGIGFTMPPQVAEDMIRHDSRNKAVLFPYLTGEDANSSPNVAASRWVVDFTALDLLAAMSYEMPFAWVNAKVRPYRQTLTNKPKQQEEWWLYERPGPALRKAIHALPEVLVIALVSKTVMPVRVPTEQVFSHMLGVFALDDYGTQAVLSSSLHQLWAITYGSTLETRVRYTPSDVFETFPLPTNTERLAAAGRTLDEMRREIMLRRDLGLTKLYNLVNDPGVQADVDITRIRDIHVEVDDAAVSAYGWDDLRLDHGFHAYRRATRWTIGAAARVETLDRLLLENHRLAGSCIDSPA